MSTGALVFLLGFMLWVLLMRQQPGAAAKRDLAQELLDLV